MNIVSREDSIYIHVFVQLKEIFSISIIAYIQEARLVEPLASGHKVRLRLSRVSKTTVTVPESSAPTSHNGKRINLVSIDF